MVKWSAGSLRGEDRRPFSQALRSPPISNGLSDRQPPRWVTWQAVGAVLVEAEPLRCPCLLAFHRRMQACPCGTGYGTMGTRQPVATTGAALATRAIRWKGRAWCLHPISLTVSMIRCTARKPCSCFRAESGKGRSQVQDMLLKTWQGAKTSTTPHVRDLSLVRVSFPWSEHPAHMLYTSLMEVRDIPEWEGIVGNALRYEYERDRNISTNTQINTILECMVYPGKLGTHEFINKFSIGEHGNITTPLFRAYLLDLAPQAADRAKLGLARALTTQDRYELLRCLWRCQQGIASDPGLQEHTRLWVYLDEAENVLDYAPAERKMLSKGLAHLVAHSSHFLTLWLNMSVEDQETVQAVKKAFGDQLWQWLDVDFTEGTEPDAGD